MACCLLAFSMACFLCSSVMEKPGGRAYVRPHLAFFSCSCASLEGFLVQVLCSWHPIPITLETAWHGRDFPHLLSHSVLTAKGENEDP